MGRIVKGDELARRRVVRWAEARRRQRREAWLGLAAVVAGSAMAAIAVGAIVALIVGASQ